MSDSSRKSEKPQKDELTTYLFYFHKFKELVSVEEARRLAVEKTAEVLSLPQKPNQG